MQEEEAREPEPADHPQLLLEAPLGLGALSGPGVAQLEPAAADLGQGAVGLGVLGARVAVAELAGRGRSAAARRAAPSRRPPPGGRRSAPPSPPARRAPSSSCRGGRARTPRGSCAAHGDERVLELGPAAIVGMDVAGRHAGDPEPLGELGEPAGCGPGRGARADAAARPGSVRGRRRRAAAARAPRRRRLAPLPGSGEGAVAGAAGEADEALVALEQERARARGGGTKGGGAVAVEAPESAGSPACASVSSRQRLRQPVALSTRRVRWKGASGPRRR